MSSTSQRRRTKSIQILDTENWRKLFPSRITTEQESCTFLKQALKIAFSTVLHCRGRLPEHCFRDVVLDGIPLKVLDSLSEHPLVKIFSKCLKGVNEALEKKYLKELHLIMYSDKDKKESSIVDHYCFSVSYPNGIGSLHLIHEKDSNEFKREVYNSTKSLFEEIIKTAKSFSPTTKEVFMDTKILYYPGTPDEYQPPGFVDSKNVPDVIKPEKSLKKISTQHHSLQVQVKQHCFQVSNSDTWISEKLDDEMDFSKRKVVPDNNVHTTELESLSTKKTLVNTNQVKCLCLIKKVVGRMAICSICNHWSHSVCYYQYEPLPSTTEYACHECKDSGSKSFNDKAVEKISKRGIDVYRRKSRFRLLILDIWSCGQLDNTFFSDMDLEEVSSFKSLLQEKDILRLSGSDRIINQKSLEEYMELIFGVRNFENLKTQEIGGAVCATGQKDYEAGKRKENPVNKSRLKRKRVGNKGKTKDISC